MSYVGGWVLNAVGTVNNYEGCYNSSEPVEFNIELWKLFDRVRIIWSSILLIWRSLCICS